MYEIAEQFEFDIQRQSVGTPREFIYVLTGKLYQSNKELSFGFPILIDGREIKTPVFPPPPKMPTPPPVRVITSDGRAVKPELPRGY